MQFSDHLCLPEKQCGQFLRRYGEKPRKITLPPFSEGIMPRLCTNDFLSFLIAADTGFKPRCGKRRKMRTNRVI